MQFQSVPLCLYIDLQTKNGRLGGGRFMGGLAVGGRGSLSCRDHCTKHKLPSSMASCSVPGASFLLTGASYPKTEP